MLNVRYLWLVLVLGVLPACSAQHTAAVAPPPRDASTPAAESAAAEPMPRTGAVPDAGLPGESHLTNLRMAGSSSSSPLRWSAAATRCT
ncbi:MAG TPA: hypothetical protein VGR27_15295 [Longimicrobiaceae bacterium]|nr:hypothetical protein [Longimicrobiaceae bacterium]